MISLEIWFQVFFDKSTESISTDSLMMRKADISVARMHEENS